MSGAISPEQRRCWEVDGWCVLEEAVPPDLLAAAQAAVSKLFPSAAAMSDATDATDDEASGRWRTWDARWPEFPFRQQLAQRHRGQ